ncbi:condensation domain-containing protein [Micromonospora sp. MSM11]|nr:condensation domain-containing protein [Micromonospora sp. MSM11]MCL7458329.1 condensation domain-containing protein [Micromonospora sp. MSM11]
MLEELAHIVGGSATGTISASVAGDVNAVFGIELTEREIATADSLVALGALVQTALTRRFAAGKADGEPRPDPSADEDLPLSGAQRRIWFMQQFSPSSTVYNVPTRLELTGPLVVEALHAALTDLLARHEILRTYYPARSGVPSVAVRPAGPADVSRVDASTEAEVDRLAEEQARIPFRLERDLSVRFVLVRRAPDRHILIGTFQHIAVDGLTLDLLGRELGALYSRHAGSGAAPTPPPARQYAEFARADAAAATSEARRRAVAERAAQLSGLPFPLVLPTDFPRPRFPRFQGDAVAVALDESLTAGVRGLARQQRVTPFAVLLAALAVVLRRAAGRPDVVVGTPAAGRLLPKWHDVAGCFINMVPVAVTVPDGSTGAGVIAGAAEAAWRALERQDVPFEDLMRTITRRNVQPLTVMLSYQVSGPPVRFAGLADTTLTVSRPAGTAKYDLSLYAVATGPALRLELEYDTDLYAAETATAILGAFRAQLKAFVADPAAVVDLHGPSGFDKPECVEF